MRYKCLIAPAKINLNLAILSRREDSYHEILSLIQAVSLHDSLYVNLDKVSEEPELYNNSFNCDKERGSINCDKEQGNLKIKEVFADINYKYDEYKIDNLNFNEITYRYERHNEAFSTGGSISFDINIRIVSWVNKLEARDNILCKVINNYFDLMPISILNKVVFKKFEIVLLKKVPFMSGLGGGSSDAASLIKFLHEDYPFMSKLELIDFSKKIGADVPFFLFSATQICSGIGENVKSFYHLKSIPCLILKPKESVSTKEAFLDYDLSWQELSEFEKRKAIASKQVNTQVFFSSIKDYYKNLKLHNKKDSLGDKNIEETKEKILKYGVNDFYNLIKRQNGIFSYIDKLLKSSGAFYSNLTGSGSAFFALYNNETELNTAYNIILNSEFRKYIEFLIACETT